MHERPRTPHGLTSLAPGRSGVGLVEFAISTSLLVAILGMIYTTADVAGSVNRTDAAWMRGEIAYRDAFYRMREELVNATMQKDPQNNLPRYSIFADAGGRQVLRFQKLIAARFKGGEVEPVWSTNIEYRVDAEGMLTRSQDGRTDVIGGGFAAMTFVATERGSFHVTAKTIQHDAKAGTSLNLTHDMDIAPVN